MKHGSLFSGIGGFDLAAEWMGWENVFHCEINPFGRKVLNYYWPDAESYEDITKTDFSKYRGTVDIISGGFPCQPFSLAGKRKGTEDDRNLWPEMLRVIREVRPRYIVGENVPGLINWSDGLVFEQVQADLENEGYEVQPVILPACSQNAPHKRERVFFVAYSNKCTTGPSRTSTRIIGKGSNNNDEPKERREQTEQHIGCSDVLQTTADTKSIYQRNERKCPDRYKEQIGRCYKYRNWQNFPTQPPICSGNDGISNRLDGITFPKWRNESIKAYGNAIVPQIALQIFKAIASSQ